MPSTLSKIIRQSVANAQPARKAVAEPSLSWWIGLDRPTFYAECKRRHPEIANSDEGRKAQRMWKP